MIDFGCGVNPQAGGGTDVIEVSVEAVVLDRTGGNDAGRVHRLDSALDYLVDYDSTGVRQTCNETVTVVKPLASLATSSLASVIVDVDAGDNVTYVTTLTNDDAVLSLYDAVVRVVLPASVQVHPRSSVAGGVFGGSPVLNVSAARNHNVVEMYFESVPGGAAATVTYVVRVDEIVEPGDLIQHRARVTFDTSAGDVGEESGRVCEAAAGVHNVTIALPQYGCQIAATALSSTTGNSVAIGERVVYTARATLIEGTQCLRVRVRVPVDAGSGDSMGIVSYRTSEPAVINAGAGWTVPPTVTRRLGWRARTRA